MIPLVAATVKCEVSHVGCVISCESALLRLRQKIKRKKPQNRSSRAIPPTTPPTIAPTGIVEELDDELDEDEVLEMGAPVKSGGANKTLVCI